MVPRRNCPVEQPFTFSFEAPSRRSCRDSRLRRPGIDRDAKTISRLAFELRQAPLEEAPLARLLRELERAPVGGTGFRGSADAPAQVGARRVREAVLAEIAALEE